MFPRDLGFRMPAEWAAHRQTFVSWPVRASMCYPGDHGPVCAGYAGIIEAVAEFEPVTVIVNPGDTEKVRALFSPGNIDFLPVPHNDAWLRDNGPTFVVKADGTVAGVNWEFNAWGGKYAPWDLDNQVAPEILKHLGIEKFDAPLVMEGGSIHTDGEGTLLTTEECLLNPNRNQGLGREQIEGYLKRFLNIEKVIWLKKGLSGDETDGHVDNIACFAASGRILMQVCSDPDDENYRITRENLEILRSQTDARGRRLDIIPVEQPPRAEYNGKRLTLSYLNFYLVNGGVIMPVFGGKAEAADRKAEDILREAFPGRRIRRVDGRAIIREGGNVHCTTQQMPAGK